MIVCYEGKMGSGMTLGLVQIWYEESRRRGLPVYTNDWNSPYQYFDKEKFWEEVNKLGKERIK